MKYILVTFRCREMFHFVNAAFPVKTIFKKKVEGTTRGPMKQKNLICKISLIKMEHSEL